jgi:hypothetical protein
MGQRVDAAHPFSVDAGRPVQMQPQRHRAPGAYSRPGRRKQVDLVAISAGQAQDLGRREDRARAGMRLRNPELLRTAQRSVVQDDARPGPARRRQRPLSSSARNCCRATPPAARSRAVLTSSGSDRDRIGAACPVSRRPR